MPSLGGATECLNSEPLGPAELRGHVVLVDFWTPRDLGRVEQPMDTADGERDTHRVKVGKEAGNAAYMGGIALGLAAVTVLAVPAAAGAKPLENDHFHEEEHDTIVECGLTLQHDRVVDGHFLFNAHGPDGLAYGGEQLRGTDTLTLPNGHTFVQTFATATKDLRVTDNGDGTLTIIGQGAGNLVVSGSDSPVVLRDTGMTRVEVLIDNAGTPTDPSDDEFLEFVGIVKESTGRNDTGEFCDDLLLIAG